MRMEPVYMPGEDSYLLAESVNELVEGKVLDMGTGSGIQAITAALKHQVTEVIAVDINPLALELAEKNSIKAGVRDKIRLVKSNLFQDISDKFDWIVFNPPYLPSEGEADELSWSGGEKGSEIIENFLEMSNKYLKKNGKILMVFSSLTNLNLENFSYKVEILKEKRLFYEKLVVVELSHL
jgi:release factor glutamine methyltransferase